MIILYEVAGVLKTIEFDATTRVVHLGTATPAEHPVQDEPDKTDDVHAEKIRLSADCVVSNTPITDTIGDVQGSYSALELETVDRQIVRSAQISGGPGPDLPIFIPFVKLGSPPQVTPTEYRDNPVKISGSALQFSQAITRTRTVNTELDGLRRAGTRVQVVTSLRAYPEMVITSISAPEEAKRSVRFTLELVEVFVGEATLVDAPVPVERRAQPTKSQGAQSTYDLPEQQKSLLKQGLEKLAALSTGAP